MQLRRDQEHLSKLYHLGLSACLITITAYSPWIVYSLLPLIGVVIYGGLRRQFIFSPHPLLFGWLFLYIVYGLSAILFWDSILSPRRLEYKLSFLIFPLLFAFQPYFKINLKYIIYSTCIGVLIASFAGITKSLLLTINEPAVLSHFLASNICINHPTYYAAFATIALSGLLLGVKYYHCIPDVKWVFIIAAFIILMILLSLSLAAITFLTAVTCLLILYLLIVKRKTKLGAIAMIIFITLISIALQNRFIRDDFKSSISSMISYIRNPQSFITNKDNHNHGDEVRLIMWSVTIRELIKHPWGVGTTNSDAVLSESLRNVGLTELATQDFNGEIRYNPHNQYLQTGLELGLLAMLFMIIYFILLIYSGIKHNNYLLSAVILILAYNCLFESMLQRQSGIVCFTFLSSLLLLYSRQYTKSAL
jgi:O-antigen ligase